MLTNGQTDSFHFMRSRYDAPFDPGQANCLILETWVPGSWKMANQLLVILHETDGGDFPASTGRSLDAPGHDRAFLTFTRFQMAGWSSDGDGALDLGRVKEVRVGWGGYLGTEGEKVEFSFAVLQTGALRTNPKAQRP